MKDNESDRQSTLAMVQSTIKAARNYFAEVEFSPQDATRTDSASLAQLTATAVSAGAQIINISDTTGTATADEIKNLIAVLFEAVPDLSSTLLSLHGHNHFKRATNNALTAISHGVRQIEGTINGVGPAGGNTDLIDVVEQLSRPGKNRDAVFAADSHLLQALGNQTCFR
jgi:2-isopropylmalate synthase